MQFLECTTSAVFVLQAIVVSNTCDLATCLANTTSRDDRMVVGHERLVGHFVGTLAFKDFLYDKNIK